ncbi:MAG: hypothetical protein Q9225_000698 [Loekoesia sp. 1 TL-2023]
MHAKRVVQILSIATALVLVALFHGLVAPSELTKGPQTGGFEDTMIDSLWFTKPTTPRPAHARIDEQPVAQRPRATTFPPGSAKPGINYSRVMVIPRMEDDDVVWISKELPKLDVSIYVVNNPRATIHPPKNKGHEVMIYLSYLIDNYNHLPDIVLFMHAHRWTHHNNLLLGFDASQMISALNGAHVMREGYVNLRCHWSPGCPEWLRPASMQDTLGKQEQTVLERCWRELFPFDVLPSFLAQPCCAQFALSRDRIRSIPQSRYVFYRDWILKTPLSDYISGRIWEYSWQYLFTRDSAHCPAEHVCYCDAFGMCFGGEATYKHHLELLNQIAKLREEMEAYDHGQHMNGRSDMLGINSTNLGVATDHAGRRSFLRTKIKDLEAELATQREQAQRRGADPRLRAEKCDRPWEDGDGF